MDHAGTVLVLEDEMLIALDLSMVLEDCGHQPFHATGVSQALGWLADAETVVTAAILDIDLGRETCFPVADALAQRGIPFIFHSAQLTHHQSSMMQHGAPAVAKPAPAERVVRAALDWRAACDRSPDTSAPAHA